MARSWEGCPICKNVQLVSGTPSSAGYERRPKPWLFTCGKCKNVIEMHHPRERAGEMGEYFYGTVYESLQGERP